MKIKIDVGKLLLRIQNLEIQVERNRKRLVVSQAKLKKFLIRLRSILNI